MYTQGFSNNSDIQFACKVARANPIENQRRRRYQYCNESQWQDGARLVRMDYALIGTAANSLKFYFIFCSAAAIPREDNLLFLSLIFRTMTCIK